MSFAIIISIIGILSGCSCVETNAEVTKASTTPLPALNLSPQQAPNPLPKQMPNPSSEQALNLLPERSFTFSSKTPHFVMKKGYPSVSYFDYIPFPGMWMQALRYLIEDDRAFGRHYAYLDEHIRTVTTEDHYRMILGKMMENFKPWLDMLEKLPQLLKRVWDVQSKKTGKTFGEALAVLLNIQRNPKTSGEFARRLSEYKRSSDDAEPDDDVHFPMIEDVTFELPQVENNLPFSDFLSRKPLFAKNNNNNKPCPLAEQLQNVGNLASAMFENSPVLAVALGAMNKVSLEDVENFALKSIALFAEIFADDLEDAMDFLDRLHDPAIQDYSIGSSLRFVLNALKHPVNKEALSRYFNDKRKQIMAQLKTYISKIMEFGTKFLLLSPFANYLSPRWSQKQPDNYGSSIPPFRYGPRRNERPNLNGALRNGLTSLNGRNNELTGRPQSPAFTSLINGRIRDSTAKNVQQQIASLIDRDRRRKERTRIPYIGVGGRRSPSRDNSDNGDVEEFTSLSDKKQQDQVPDFLRRFTSFGENA